MRIVIDLQGAQSTGSRNRGIGRYSMSLALAMVRNRGNHEILIALNGLFAESIEPIRAAFNGLLPQANIRVWHAVAPVSELDSTNEWRRKSAELLREAFLASLKPDVVHVASLFEGLSDDAVTSIGAFVNDLPTAVTLYDLIPFIYRKPYLDNPLVEAWYLRKFDCLQKADLCLAISESSRQEGIEYLNFSEAQVINVSTAADAHFRRQEIAPECERELRQKYGLARPFVMYTGGIDHRKNIEGLIRAFARLAGPLRHVHQLAIVCSAQPESRSVLEQLAASQGLAKDEVIFTGFVPEDDLVALYNLCKLFVFPSWHEGFGLPALEAMHCGAPVIGANTSSLPEVIGWDEALFDPRSEEAIANAITRGLTDDAFRDALVSHGKCQAERFSWDESAKRTITAFEALHAKRTSVEPAFPPRHRPRLAYVSPLPPERTGIADYSAELLPELSRLYEIDVIVAQNSVTDASVKSCCTIRSVEWFIDNAERYDRVLYHFGNSTFHQHMFDLLKVVPGVVVLHDFFLSGIVAHMDVNGFNPGGWDRELYRSHGYKAVQDRFLASDSAEVVWKYPCNLSVLQDSLGVIVHSRNSMRLAEQWYGVDEASEWAEIPLLRVPKIEIDKASVRAKLGVGDDALLVCTFGLLGPSKLNHRLLEAWLSSVLAEQDNCYLVFVGANHEGGYGQELEKRISESNVRGRIRITGWVDAPSFHQYLAAADVGVQLRTLSRGETSAAVLDCMNYGLATIVNANGSMADLPNEGVWKLPDEFSDGELINALETLSKDKVRCRELGEAARKIVLHRHNPRACATQYHDAIESFYQVNSAGIPVLANAIASLDSNNSADLASIAAAIALSISPMVKHRQLFVDVSALVQPDSKNGIQRIVRNILREWLLSPPDGCRVEPVYATQDYSYRYARWFSLRFMGCQSDALDDEPIDFFMGDIFLGLDLQPHVVVAQQGFYQKMHHQGACVKFVEYDLLPLLQPKAFIDGVIKQHMNWLNVVAQSDSAICSKNRYAACVSAQSLQAPVIQGLSTRVA